MLLWIRTSTAIAVEVKVWLSRLSYFPWEGYSYVISVGAELNNIFHHTVHLFIDLRSLLSFLADSDPDFSNTEYKKIVLS